MGSFCSRYNGICINGLVKWRVSRVPMGCLHMDGQQNRFGVDFGLKPRVLVVGDMEFAVGLSASLVALGYMLLPQFRGERDVPAVALLFDDENQGRQSFERFRGWIDASDDAEALRLSFVELRNGNYGLVVYQGPEQLTQRCLHPAGTNDVEPLLMAGSFFKEFPGPSDGLRWLKKRAADGRVIFLPAFQGGLLPDLALAVPHLPFYTEDDVPEGSIEANLLRTRPTAGCGERSDHPCPSLPEPTPPVAGSVSPHRRAQLSRLFPVTIERLTMASGFKPLMEQLKSEGFRRWQVLQSCCTLSLAARAPELFTNPETTGDPDMQLHSRLLEHLWSVPEDALTITMVAVPELFALRQQLEADARVLLRCVTDDAHVIPARELQAELAARGLLGE